MDNDLPSDSAGHSAPNRPVLREFTYNKYCMSENLFGVYDFLSAHYAISWGSKGDEDYDPSVMIHALDIASDGSVSKVKLPSGPEVTEVLLVQPQHPTCLAGIKGYRDIIQCVEPNLQTRIVLVDQVTNPIFLETFAHVYEFDREMVMAFMNLWSGHPVSPKYHADLHLPAYKCSKLREQILDLGYGRFAFSKKTKTESDESHEVNVIFSQY